MATYGNTDIYGLFLPYKDFCASQVFTIQGMSSRDFLFILLKRPTSTDFIHSSQSPDFYIFPNRKGFVVYDET